MRDWRNDIKQVKPDHVNCKACAQRVDVYLKSVDEFQAALTAKDKQIAELRAFSVKAGSWTLGELYDASAKDAQLAKYKAALKKIRAYTGDAHICEITSAALAEGDGSGEKE